MKITPLLLLGLLLYTTVAAQEQVTLSGTIKAESTGETLIGATVSADGKYATQSNAYGFYSLSLPKGKHVITISSVSYASYRDTLDIQSDLVHAVKLSEAAQALEEVVISSSQGRSLSSPQMGVSQITPQSIKNVPVLMGEKDVVKVLQLLPGVKSAGDGNSGMYVRGGAADQNLILLDEATVYNASHLLGFFSTFNSDAIKDVTMYKGGMPAQYGGRLSSVLDIKMNDGNNQDFRMNGGVGLISARLNAEGPIQQGKSSFLVSGRRTYVDAFLKLSNDSSINNNSMYFYDLNAKLNFELGEKDHLYFSGYLGNDHLGVGDLFGLDWGNTTGTLRWNHVFNSKLFSNTSVIYSDYDYKISINSGVTDFEIYSNIRDINLKQDFQWYLNNKNSLRFGLQTVYHTIRPGEVTGGENSAINDRFLQDRYSWENALYATNTWKASDKFNVTYGVRLSAFSILGSGDFYDIDGDGNVLDTMHYQSGEFVKTYMNVEPRVAMSYRINPNSSVKASYARNAQYLHLVSNSTSASPTDKWLASTNIIKPELSDEFSLGYYRNLANNNLELNVETYYKDLHNQIDYRDGADIYSVDNAIESDLLFGKGRAYGIEWLLKKPAGRLSGWISYTLSKTERQIDGINDGKWYNARQDRTHDIAVVAMYKLNDKWSLSANWVFYTGDAVTFPAGKYIIDDQTTYYYTARNAYRMPNYHRLDLGATLQLKQRKRWTSELSFSLYNAYGRENAYVIQFQDAENDPNRTVANRIALFKFIPSVSYNFKFK